MCPICGVLLQNQFCWTLQCFIKKSVLSRLMCFCVQKNWVCGEQITNMRYGGILKYMQAGITWGLSSQANFIQILFLKVYFGTFAKKCCNLSFLRLLSALLQQKCCFQILLVLMHLRLRPWLTFWSSYILLLLTSLVSLSQLVPA